MLLLELLRGQAGAEQVCPSLAARESLIPFLPPHPNYSNKMPVSMRNHDTHWHARTYTRNRNIHDLTYTLFYFFSPLLSHTFYRCFVYFAESLVLRQNKRFASRLHPISIELL